MSKSKLESIEIALPGIPEQRRIVATHSERLSALFRAKEVAELQKEGIDILDRCIRESLLSNGAETSLANVARISARLVEPTEQQYRDLPHINGENIEAETGRLGRYQTAAEDKVFSQKFKFDKGDVLYSKLRPYLRKAAIAPSDGLCSADMYPLKVSKDRLLPEFLLLKLLSDRFSRYAIEKSARSRMPKLNREALFAWKMTLPSLDEQKSIVSKARTSTAALKSLQSKPRSDGRTEHPRTRSPPRHLLRNPVMPRSAKSPAPHGPRPTASPRSIRRSRSVCDVLRRSKCAGAMQYVPELT